MSNLGQAVRDAAAALHTAIAQAEAGGCKVEWPRRASGLPAIAVSEIEPPAETKPVEPPKARRKEKAPDAA